MLFPVFVNIHSNVIRFFKIPTIIIEMFSKHFLREFHPVDDPLLLRRVHVHNICQTDDCGRLNAIRDFEADGFHSIYPSYLDLSILDEDIVKEMLRAEARAAERLSVLFMQGHINLHWAITMCLPPGPGKDMQYHSWWNTLCAKQDALHRLAFQVLDEYNINPRTFAMCKRCELFRLESTSFRSSLVVLEYERQQAIKKKLALVEDGKETDEGESNEGEEEDWLAAREIGRRAVRATDAN